MILKNVMILLIVLSSNVFAQEIKDKRICNDIERDSRNRIIRDQKILRDFQKLYPCPSTKKRYGNCPGHSIDHVIPKSCGGCESIENLQWLPNEIKSCAEDYCKDRFERKVYRNKYNHPHCK